MGAWFVPRLGPTRCPEIINEDCGALVLGGETRFSALDPGETFVRASPAWEDSAYKDTGAAAPPEA